MSQDFEYDVFFGYSGKDKLDVLELATRLKKDGVRVWLDEWEIQPDDPISPTIEQGLEQSRALVLAMSKNTFASDWATLERHTILFRDPADQQRRFIPLRLDNAPIENPLKQFAYVDWRTRSEEQYAKLLAVCRRPKTREERFDCKSRRSPQKSIVLKGHAGEIWDLAITPDVKTIISGSQDHSLNLWDMANRECIKTLKGHQGAVYSVAITPNGNKAISGSMDGAINIWDLKSGECTSNFSSGPSTFCALAVSPDGEKIVTAHVDGLKIWELESRRYLFTIPTGNFISSYVQIAITPDGKYLVATDGTKTNSFSAWSLESGERVLSFKGHSDYVLGVCTTPDGKSLISSSKDKTIRIWDMESGQCLSVFEGHKNQTNGVAVTPDGKCAASASSDQTIKVWDLPSGRCIETFHGHKGPVSSVAVTPDGKNVVSASLDKEVRIWTLPDPGSSIEPPPAKRYTNAKIILSGDSGVGKSGLAMRLTENRFAPTVSTNSHWAAQLKLPLFSAANEIDREIWLWDFAGQADYRQSHQLFMDETVMVIQVFNPRSENPFKGISQWDRDIDRVARRDYHKLLVAGRCDRGGLMVSRKSIDKFAMERHYTHFLETSALTGEGCDKLRGVILENIDWDSIPWTASPRIFKRLKDEIFTMRDEGVALLRMGELKQRLELRLPDESFSPGDVRAVVGLLAGPGIVLQLEFGDFTLLQPERIDSYAGAVIRSVSAHTEEHGSIAEEDVLAGRLRYKDVRRLPPSEEEIVLRALHQTFIRHGLCWREHTDAGARLVFPSYFRREAPEDPGRPPVLVSYRFSGAVDAIYATLVVRLYYTQAFENDRLWRFAADFKSNEGWRMGLKMTRRREGSAEISVYFDPRIPLDATVTFIKYVHEHLLEKADDVVRLRRYVCPHCGTPVENRQTVQKRLERGDEDILCVDCEKRIPLWDLIEEKFASAEFREYVKSLEERAKAAMDNESKELILIGHAFAIAGEAGQIFRTYSNSDHGIDGEIEFKDRDGKGSGKRIHLQLKSDDSYLYERKRDNAEIFRIKRQRWASYWRRQACPVMLVIRASDNVIRWMDVSARLKEKSREGKERIRQITFDGEPFTALNLQRMRDRLLPGE